jgi:hypothetical protein
MYDTYRRCWGPGILFSRIRYLYGSGSDMITDPQHCIPYTATFPGGRYGLGLLKITATLLPGVVALQLL